MHRHLHPDPSPARQQFHQHEFEAVFQTFGNIRWPVRMNF
jgi:hypothetical protein